MTATKSFPFVARIRRDGLMRPSDTAEWHATADRIAGTDRWYAWAGWKQEFGFTMIGFASQAEADEMQRWIAASGIETRPAQANTSGRSSPSAATTRTAGLALEQQSLPRWQRHDLGTDLTSKFVERQLLRPVGPPVARQSG